MELILERLHPRGLKNTGTICYFNALLQGILSCPNLVKYFLTHDHKSEISKDFKRFINNEIDNVQLWKTFVTKTRFPAFGRGQEDASEGLTLLFQSIDCKQLDYHLLHKYEKDIKCGCNNNQHIDESIICEISEQDLEQHDGNLNEYILNHVSELSDYKCDKCKKPAKNQHSSLKMIPEIFIIQYKKFHAKFIGSTPKYLKIPSKKRIMAYELMCQVMHSGNMNGGHYWAICSREDGNYNINDASVTKSEELYTPKKTSYLLWYQFVGYTV